MIPCLSFPTERPRRRSHHLQRDHQAEYGVRNTLELDLTRKPALLQVVLAGCAEAAAAARASERPSMCPWVETAQRPTPTRAFASLVAMASSSFPVTSYHIGTPGVPWGTAEKAAWRDQTAAKRSYFDEVQSTVFNVTCWASVCRLTGGSCT